MQTIYAFSYNPVIATGTNTTGTNWRMAYQQPLMLYRGTTNQFRIVVFNVQQKVVNLTNYDVQLQIVDRESKEHFVTKTATITAPASGVASIAFNADDLRNLQQRFYHIIARLVNKDDGSTITYDEILYLDDNYGAFTPVTIEGAWDFSPTTISTTDGIAEFRFTNLVDAPTSYVGFGNKYVRVNDTEDGLEFIDVSVPNLLATGNVIPSANVTYSLGNEDFQWKDLWVSNSTIYLNSIPLSIDSNGNLTVGGNIIPKVADIYLVQDAAPTNISGSLWYNSTEGKLYINYNDTWVDANPTQIDPTALRADQNGSVELPSGLKFDPASLYAPTLGTVALQTADESLQILATGVNGMSAFGWARNPINQVGSIASVIFSSAGASIGTGNSIDPNVWNFDQSGNLTLPEGGEILTASGSIYTAYGDDEVAAYLISHPPAGTYGNSNVAAYLPTALPAYNTNHNWTPVMTGVVQQGDNADSFRRTLPFDYSWGAQVYSREGYTRGCFMSAVFTGPLVTFGLTSRPTVNNSIAIDYRFESAFDGGNIMSIREGGVVIEENVGLYADAVAKIVYDGTNIIYYIDDTVIRTVARPIGAALHFAANWYYADPINNVKFGPYGNQQTPGVGIPSDIPVHSYGKPGDLKGMVAFDGTYMYYCMQNYVNNSTTIWDRVAFSGNTW